jgi:hypothetical protein
VLAYSTRGEIRIGSYQWVQIPWLAAFKASVAKWCPWALLSGAIYWLNRKLPVAPDALVKRLLIHLPLSIVFTIAYTYGHCQVDENRLTRPQEIAVWSRCGPDKLCRSSEIVRQLDNARLAHKGFRGAPERSVGDRSRDIQCPAEPRSSGRQAHRHRPDW